MGITCTIMAEVCPRPRTFQRPLALVIPAHNEAAHLPRLLRGCAAVEPARILVVDDASTDATPRVLDRLAAEPGLGSILRVLRNPQNLGKQGSVRRGLRALFGGEEPGRWSHGVALIDGDGQHDPAELPALAELLQRYPLVIGCRSQAQMPGHRRLSNWLVNTGFAVIGGVDFGDVQSGLRLYRAPLARELARRLPEAGGYGLEHESLAVLAAYARRRDLELRAAAAPVSCRYGEAQSGIGPLEVLHLASQTVVQALRLRQTLAMEVA